MKPKDMRLSSPRYSRLTIGATLVAQTGSLPWIFLILAVLGSARADEPVLPHPVKAPLMTRWAAEVGPTNALPDYPRPQLVRKDWLNLNGLWDYAITPASDTKPRSE